MVPAVTLDVHALDQFLLVSTGVLLLAILAVRLSVGVGLPSLLVYLLMGVALGEAGLGITSRTPSWRTRSVSARWSSSWPKVV